LPAKTLAKTEGAWYNNQKTKGMVGISEIEITQIQLLISESKIIWTEHIAIRLRERGIKREELIECIKNGEIIEQYPDDTPYPSCLISGFCKAGKPLHVVIGLDYGVLCCMITAYRPSLDKWEEDFKTRKGGE